MARYNEAQVQMPSIGNVGAVQTQSTKEVDLLSKDIEGLIGGAQKANQAVYEASEYATKLAAIDTDYNTQKGFEEIYNQTVGAKLGRGEQPTSEDYKTMIDWRTNFFKDTLTNVAGEDDTSNTIYKEMFYKPSREVLDRYNNKDIATYKTLLTQEKYNASATKTKNAPLTYNNPKNIASEIESLVLSGGDREQASKFVWGNVTTNQIEKIDAIGDELMRAYVGAGKVDELVDTYLGNFLKYEDGNLPSKEGVDDASAIRMRDNLNQRISKAQRELAQLNKTEEVKTKTTQTVVKTSGKFSFDSPTDAIERAVNSSLMQAQELYDVSKSQQDNTAAQSNYQAALQGSQDMAVIQEQNEYFSTISKLFLEDPESVSFEDKDFETYIPNIRGLTETTLYSRLKETDVVSAASSAYMNGYEKAIKAGDTVTAQKYVKAIAVLSNRGYETSAINLVDKKFANQNNFTGALKQQPSVKSFMSVIDSASAYKEGTNSDIQFLTPEVIESINTQYNTLQQEVLARKTTDKEALTKLKLAAGINIDNTTKSSFTTEDAKSMARKLELNPDNPNELDSLLKSWYNVGVAAFGDGSLMASYQYLMAHKSQQMTTPDAAKRELKNILTKVDSTGMPWSKGLALANVTGKDDKEFNNNLKSHILYRIGEMSAANKIDFDSLYENIENNDVAVSQRYHYVPESGTKELLTKITLFSNGVQMGTMVLRPSELKQDFSSKVKYKYPKAFNVKTKKEDYSVGGVPF